MPNHFIIREQLYPEENYADKGIPQQVVINCDYLEPPMETYILEKENHLFIVDSPSSTNTRSRSSTVKIIFYVKDENIALELAYRWVNEEKQKVKDYRVIGVDHYCSVFD